MSDPLPYTLIIYRTSSDTPESIPCPSKRAAARAGASIRTDPTLDCYGIVDQAGAVLEGYAPTRRLR